MAWIPALLLPTLWLAATRTSLERTAATASAALVARSRHGPVRCADLQAFGTYGARELAQVPGEDDSAWRRRLLERHAAHAALAAEALALGAASDPEFQSRWANKRRPILVEAERREIARQAQVSPAEIERAFEAHRDDYARPEAITTRLILRRVQAAAGEVAWRKEELLLADLRRRVLAGESFGALAREFSHAENASRGGTVKTSPRGTLLAEFEAVAWSLEPGEVSEVVRLHDGPALVLLERRLPAQAADLTQVERAVERHLHQEAERRATEAALVRGCGAWPLADAAERVLAAQRAGASQVEIGGVELDWTGIGLQPEAPWWEERVAGALESLCLARVAELRSEPAVAEHLEFERTGLLGAYAMSRRLAAEAPELSDDELRRLYDQRQAAFREPEVRSFEVVTVEIGGDQRAARERARRAAELWRASGAPGAEPIERWSRLPRAALGAATSPLLASRAFALPLHQPSDPVPLERYRIESSNFEIVGYAILRPIEIVPAFVRPLTEVRERLHLRARPSEEVERILAEVIAGADLEIDDEALARCPVPHPASAAGPNRAPRNETGVRNPG